ncbi:MAG: cupin-like domain-containing protein [Vitreoscilla sp.]
MECGFSPVREVWSPDGRSLGDADGPFVLRGAASGWPAVNAWSFESLAAAVPDVQVELVQGNREAGNTRLVRSSLRQYLASLQRPAVPGTPPSCLKEFDLLRSVPRLREDLSHRQLLPPRMLSSTRCWIGPAGAETGLHHDYLDNVAVQILGVKRWSLVRPGLVERLQAVSSKYDPWAVLANASAAELATRGGSGRDFFSVDLMPGDVLHVPAHWWHEVRNLTPALMFGGFHGRISKVLVRSAWVGARNLRHRLIGGECTCHGAS